MDNPWQHWLDDQLGAPGKRVSPLMAAMYRMYGKTAGKKCKTCRHLLTKKMGGTYHKCELARITAGPATDWRLRWDACGKYEMPSKTEE